MAPSIDCRQTPTSWGQLRSVLRKNYAVQTRSGRCRWAGGWAGLTLDVLFPALFFLIMCLPKRYIPPQHNPAQLPPLHDLDAPAWGSPYEGHASMRGNARVLFAPNTSAVQDLMMHLARAAACPIDSNKTRFDGDSFYRFFRPPSGTPQACTQSQQACLADEMCYAALVGTDMQLQGFDSMAAALDEAERGASGVDAVLDLSAWAQGTTHSATGGGGGSASACEASDAASCSAAPRPAAHTYQYTLRFGHSSLPSTRVRLAQLDVAPDEQYRQYYWAANLQALVDSAALAHAAQRVGAPPPRLLPQFKPFPWPEHTVDVGAAAVAVFFKMLLVYAFMGPMRAAVALIVQEKELGLREGLRLQGLSDAAYWGSWALSQWSLLAASFALCAVVGLYPFRHSDATLLLLLYWLTAAALLAFAFCLSTFFSRARVAGTAAGVVYVLAMVPGYLAPQLQPFGGAAWPAACLLPPSAMSMLAHVLIKQESLAKGVSWATLRQPITPEFPFSAGMVGGMLVLDVLLYCTLLWYLDDVMPSPHGTTQPWHFPLHRNYWRSKIAGAGIGAHALDGAAAGKGGAPAAEFCSVTKSFPLAGRQRKVAVHDLTLAVPRGRVTALLGHNGAGKTTAISILTGVMPPSAGEVRVGGANLRAHPAAARAALGVCPQFDLLWPLLTVAEHLDLVAAVKGFTPKQRAALVAGAAEEVGLADKLSSAAGDLSGGQRRKLSVAIAFLGDPSVAVLDEPTSGMDPASRKLTWEVIRQRRRSCAVLLTTHSMQEADALADGIAIMAGGRLAAQGTPLELKARYGVGYTLTVSDEDAAPARKGAQLSQALLGLVQEHVPGARAVAQPAGANGEAAFLLPKEAAGQLPALLRALGARAYGLHVTTLEEVFLRVTKDAAAATADGGRQKRGLRTSAGGGGKPDEQDAPALHVAPGEYLSGLKLWWAQFQALFLKRAACALRDRPTLLAQTLLPVALVVLALWASSAAVTLPQQQPLHLNRVSALGGRAAPLGAHPTLRTHDADQLQAFVAAYPALSLRDAGAVGIEHVDNIQLPGGTLDDALLGGWFDSAELAHDALFVEELPGGIGAPIGRSVFRYAVLVNQTAVHALPAALNQVHSAALRYITGDAGASIDATLHPLPMPLDDLRVQISEIMGTLLLLLCVGITFAGLAASFAVFPVRERRTGARAAQATACAKPFAFWAASFAWDLLYYAAPALGVLSAFAKSNLSQFGGRRLWAVGALLGAFPLGALPLTYALQLLFQDEVRAMVCLNSLFFATGFLGFLATVLLETIQQFVPEATGPTTARDAIGGVLGAAAPHYGLARGLYEIAESNKFGADPFAWGVTGKLLACMAAQGVMYMAVLLLLEGGALQRLQRRARRWPICYAQSDGTGEDLAEHEDEGVAAEKAAIQSGQADPSSDAIVLAGVKRTYRQRRAPAVHAVRGLHLAVPPGECFGLLGHNGAGKTTTFRMLTGEELPDEGDAFVAGASMVSAPASVRRAAGYCPQHNAAPVQMTAREVLRMFAALRGVPGRAVRPVVARLLSLLGLEECADRPCGTYSGGQQRKLAVASALVGDCPVILLDEPTTGMDPGARHALWGVVQTEVQGSARSVVLSSHSMEECETVCGRVGILAAGRLRCVGTVAALKARYAQGYRLELRCAPGGGAAAAALVLRCASGARLEDAQPAAGHLAFTLPRAGLDLPLLIERLEGASSGGGGEGGCVEEWAVGEATLEQVFLGLADGGKRA